jgi:hypothetical protein
MKPKTVAKGVNGVVLSFSIPFSNDSINCLSSTECVELFYTKLREAEAKFKEIGFSIAVPLKPLYTKCEVPICRKQSVVYKK